MKATTKVMNQIKFATSMFADALTKFQAWQSDPDMQKVCEETEQLLEKGVPADRLMDPEMKLGDSASCCRMTYTVYHRLLVLQLLAVGSKTWPTFHLMFLPRTELNESELEQDLPKLDTLLSEALEGDAFLNEKAGDAVSFVRLQPGAKFEDASSMDEVTKMEAKLIDGFKHIKTVVGAFKRSFKDWIPCDSLSLSLLLLRFEQNSDKPHVFHAMRVIMLVSGSAVLSLESRL